ncbi:hypothetical protein STAQ_27500 [Allostella sp. ATCC 35155]|nr:hypothetical protein STAQ_27500 [Stella sp. ATCC 35155]
MLSRIGRLLGGIGIPGWLLGGLVLAAAGYVATTQVVLHNRQKALDAAVAAGQTLSARNATLTGQLDQLQALNARNVETLARLQADHDRDLADLDAKLARAEKAGRTLYLVQQENARDPDANRPLGDVCPLLDRFLERVRDEGGAAPAPGGGGDPGGREEAPARPADVRRRAGSSAAPVDR